MALCALIGSLASMHAHVGAQIILARIILMTDVAPQCGVHGSASAAFLLTFRWQVFLLAAVGHSGDGWWGRYIGFCRGGV